MKKHTISILVISCSLFLFTSCKKTITPPKAVGPTPSEKQLKWHDMEFYAFTHFSLNTFTNKEWGYGNESPKLFNPSALDTKQWARIIKDAGMKGIIITAKHHDGFCLWPSAYTERSVKNSPWKNGKGDVIKELAESCRAYGLKLGIYLSPWDRSRADYGKPEYVTYFRNQLKELLTNYGDVFEMWFDGANGGDGYYNGANEIRKINTLEYYNWDETYKMIYKIAPKTLVWGIGPAEARWIGNEEGYANKKNWSLLRQKDELAGKVNYTEFMSGHENGEKWVPGEVDVSTRPGWFYHAVEDDKVKSLEEMVDIYYHSIGRNANLILNIPPDKRGLINEHDEARLKAFAAIIKADFKTELLVNSTVLANNVRGNSKTYAAKKVIDSNNNTYWATDDNVKTASIEFKFEKPTPVNRILLQEYIKLGQRVKAFNIEAKVNGEWQTIANETTIGYKRILRTKRVTVTAIKINITDAKACIVLSEIKAYNAPTLVRQPIIKRDKNGVVIVTAKKDNLIYYTLDGTKPSADSHLYNTPFKCTKAVNIKAVSLNIKENLFSAVTTSKYGISKEKWKIISTNSSHLKTVDQIIDGNPRTTWSSTNKLPLEIIIDMGNSLNINGLTYYPKQVGSNLYLISKYEFYTSTNKIKWKKQSAGEFSNIKNNPIKQVKMFKPCKARYLKFVAKASVDHSDNISIGEIGVIENK